MKSTQQLLAAGIAFLIVGVTFFAVGLVTQQSAFYGIGPAFLTIGIVFIATAKTKRG